MPKYQIEIVELSDLGLSNPLDISPTDELVTRLTGFGFNVKIYEQGKKEPMSIAEYYSMLRKHDEEVKDYR